MTESPAGDPNEPDLRGRESHAQVPFVAGAPDHQPVDDVPADDGGLAGPGPAETGTELDLDSAMHGPDWGGRRRPSRQGSSHGTHARGHSARHGRRRLKWVLLGTGIFAVLVIAAVGWLAYSGVQAKHDLEAVRDGVHTLRAQIASGDLKGARATADKVIAQARDAHDETTGPLWATAASIPGLGEPLDTARAVTTSVDLVAGHALTSLVDASDGLRPSNLRQPDGSFDLAPLTALAPRIARAQGVLTQAVRQLHAAAGSTWLSSVDNARKQLIDEINGLQPTLNGAHRAALVVPPLLGADGPRTYMVSFLSGAEIRATGGLPGAFGILRVDHGKLQFTTFRADDYLLGERASGSSLGLAFQSLYQAAPADYRDSTSTPNFPDVAAIWSSMWQHKTGQKLDGAISVDPTAVSYLLAVTGPIAMPEGPALSAQNVVQLTQNTVYTTYEKDTPKRKQYQLDVAKAVSTHLLSPSTDVTNLIKAARHAANENRLQLFTTDKSVEAQLATVPLGGVVPETNTKPYFAIGLNNESQSKLDYWLHADVTWQRTSCSGKSDIVVTVKLTNDAPDPKTTHVPAYVLGNSSPPGANSTNVVVYGSIGSDFVSNPTINGKGGGANGAGAVFHLQGFDRKHGVEIVETPVPLGKTVTLEMHLKEPYIKGPPDVRAQPMINSMRIKVEDACT